MYPYIFQLGHFSLPTFGALAALGLMLAMALSLRTARLARLSPDALWNAGVFAVIAAFVASRLLLVLLHLPSFIRYPALLLAVPSLTAGGLLLTLAATLLWLRWKGLNVWRALDAWAPCGLLVWAFLALGHLAEGSDPGMVSTYGLRLPGESARSHPVALYTCAAALLLAWAGYRVLLRGGPAAATALAGAGVAQFLLSFLRQPGLDGGGGLDLLQWVALGLLAAGVALRVAGTIRPDGFVRHTES